MDTEAYVDIGTYVDARAHLDAGAYVGKTDCCHTFPDGCTDRESRAYAVSYAYTITDAQPVLGSNNDAGDRHDYGHRSPETRPRNTLPC